MATQLQLAPPAHFTLRRATLADADAVCRFSRASFSATFGHLYSSADLATYLEESLSLSFFQGALTDSLRALWIALTDEAGEALVVGYALAGPVCVPHAAARPVDGELLKLYVAEAFKGRGVAQALLAPAVAWVRAGRCCADAVALAESFAPGGTPPCVYVGVWSENFRAIAFYSRTGCRVVGEYLYEVGGARDRELIMRLDPLDGGAGGGGEGDSKERKPPAREWSI